MRQRVSLARTLASEPKILLMDEPFAALDEQTRLLLGDKVLQIQQQLKQTTLLITHNITEAVQMSDRILVMTYRPGKVKRIVDIDRLVVTPDAETDFWRETFYGFIHDNGHFYHRDVHGDFTAEITLVGGYEHLYDQSGLMVRGDEQHWLKAGLGADRRRRAHEHRAHARLLRLGSAWRFPSFDGRLRLRLTRHGDAIRVEFALPGGDWQLQRLGHLPLPETCLVGPMCCAPVEAGFEAAFEGFTISGPIARDLHG